MTAVAPSRLDDIDPTTIESIDVLRGPSASSLYGTDAANGVIVIKTKRGHAGSWHADLSGDNGWSVMSGNFGDQWWGWGNIGQFYTGTCTLVMGGRANIADGSCVQDSVRNFNYENDPEMRTFGTGTSQTFGGSVSGGADRLQQFFSLRASNEIGAAKMSAAQQRLIARLWSAPAPSWMVHPNTSNTLDGTSRSTFQVARNADISFTANAIYRNVLNSGSGVSIPDPLGRGGASPSDTLSLLPSDGQRTRVTSAAKRGVVATTGTYSPWGWLAVNSTLGGDYTLRNDQSNLRAQDCTVLLQTIMTGTSACPSGHAVRNDETLIKTANVGAQLSFAPFPGIQLNTSIGEQYSHLNFSTLQVGNNAGNGCSLAFGTTLLTPAPICLSNSQQWYSVQEDRDEAAKAGWYIEQAVHAFGLYTTFGLRRDVASGFGGVVNKSPPNYPKFDFSYPLSEQPFFPKQSIVSSLRLRLAYGQSGNVTSQTAVLNQYTLEKQLFTGATVPSNLVHVTQLGNADLKPERGTEWEGGFDVSFLENERLRTEFNLYRKFTRDAINQLLLAGSYGMDTPVMYVNLGNVENRGIELTATGRILDTRPLGWELAVHWAKNTNKLVHKSPIMPEGSGIFRNVEGYPLLGYWGVPVVSYADANHDGILEADEVVFGDAKFMGAPYPRGEVTYNNSVTLLNGTLRVNASVDQIIGVSNIRTVYMPGPYPRGAVDRTAPLAEQAAWIQANVDGSIGAATYIGEASSVRLNELSVTYTVPPALVQRLIRGRSLTLTLAGRNLALWTNYVGKDPNVSTNGNADIFLDDGTGVPQPRNLSLRFNLGL